MYRDVLSINFNSIQTNHPNLFPLAFPQYPSSHLHHPSCCENEVRKKIGLFPHFARMVTYRETHINQVKFTDTPAGSWNVTSVNGVWCFYVDRGTDVPRCDRGVTHAWVRTFD